MSELVKPKLQYRHSGTNGGHQRGNSVGFRRPLSILRSYPQRVDYLLQRVAHVADLQPITLFQNGECASDSLM